MRNRNIISFSIYTYIIKMYITEIMLLSKYVYITKKKEIKN